MRKLFLLLSVLFVVSCSSGTEEPAPVIKYTLTTSANPTTGGTITPASGQHIEGATVSITATPAAEYLFSSWTGATGTTATTSVVMNSNKTVTANFVKKKYALTTSVEGEGTVTEKVIKAGAATDYNSGTIVELTASPSAEWLFVKWTGDLTGTENPTQITIDKAKTVTAVFVKKQYALTIEIEGEGTVAEKVIKAGAATDYNSGTVVELTATPKDGWKFKEWSEDLESTENPAEITIDKAKTIKAVFAYKVYIPDDNFERYLINQGFDDVLDDYVLKINIIGIEELNISFKGIKILDGIEHFENLKKLDVQTNNLTKIDISKNLKLEELLVSNTSTPATNYNRINEINLTNNTSLKIIKVRDIGLLSIDVSTNSKLEELSLGNNHSWEAEVSTVDLSNNSELKHLSIGQLTTFSSIDLSNNSNLEELYLTSLTSMNALDVSKLKNLKLLNIGDTPINSIDLSQNESLENYIGLYNSNIGPNKIDFTNNSKLKQLNLRKGAINEIKFSENNSVQVISFEAMNEVLIRNVISNLNQLNRISIRRVTFDEKNLNLNSKKLESLLLIYNNGLSCVSVSSETKTFLESDNGFLVIRDNDPEITLTTNCD